MKNPYWSEESKLVNRISKFQLIQLLLTLSVSISSSNASAGLLSSVKKFLSKSVNTKNSTYSQPNPSYQFHLKHYFNGKWLEYAVAAKPKTERFNNHANQTVQVTPNYLANSGEDAYMASSHNGKYVFGCADGVGSWKERGIQTADKIALELLNGVQIALKSTEPSNQNCSNQTSLDLLQNSHVRLLNGTTEDLNISGSATACVAMLEKDKAKKYRLSVCHVGDSGYMIIRGGQIKRSIPQYLAEYSGAPLQVGKISNDHKDTHLREIYNNGELLDLGSCYSYELIKGDLLIIASDGLWDNLTESEIRLIFDKESKKSTGELASAFLKAASENNRKPDDSAISVIRLK